MRAVAHMSTPASLESSGTRSSAPLRRWAVAALLVGAASATAACTSSATTHEPAWSGSSPTAAVSGSPTTKPPITGPRPATTPVNPPSPGDISHTVPVGAASAKPAVALTAPGNFGGRVTVHVTGLTATTAQARGPGEVSGPGLVLTLRIENSSAKAIDLGNVVVALEDSTGAQASPMSASPAHPFTGVLAAAGHQTGVYVYTLPKADRKPVTVQISYTTEAPVVVFVGDAP